MDVSYVDPIDAPFLLRKNHFYPSPHTSLGHTETLSFVPLKSIKYLL